MIPRWWRRAAKSRTARKLVVHSLRFSARKRVAWTLALVFSLTAFATSALADDYVDFDPSKQTPSVSAPLYVVLAYSAIWLAVIGFAVMIWRRQRTVDEEIVGARQRLEELDERLDNLTTRIEVAHAHQRIDAAEGSNEADAVGAKS
jgi:hypothetical protein